MHRCPIFLLVLAAALVPQAASHAGNASPGQNTQQPVCDGTEGYSVSFSGRRTFFFEPAMAFGQG